MRSCSFLCTSAFPAIKASSSACALVRAAGASSCCVGKADKQFIALHSRQELAICMPSSSYIFEQMLQQPDLVSSFWLLLLCSCCPLLCGLLLHDPGLLALLLPFYILERHADAGTQQVSEAHSFWLGNVAMHLRLTVGSLGPFAHKPVQCLSGHIAHTSWARPLHQFCLPDFRRLNAHSHQQSSLLSQQHGKVVQACSMAPCKGMWALPCRQQGYESQRALVCTHTLQSCLVATISDCQVFASL